MNKALLIIDIQNFYFGKDGLKGCEQASQNARRLLDSFREKNLPVFYIRHEIDTSHLSEEEKKTADIHDSVKPMDGEPVISKHSPGSFKGTSLLKQLKSRNIDELVICGMMSQMCVDTTTREAADLDFKCTVIHDACATRNFEFKGMEIPAEFLHAAAMSSLAFAFAKVISTEEYLVLCQP